MSSSVDLLTYSDVIDWLVDYRQANPSAESLRDARRAMYSALRVFPNAHKWSYYYQQGRVATVAPYDTGTILYDHTGGGVEREVTLTGGVWPSWAAFGVLVIDSVMYQVAERKSDTILQLTIHSNLQADVTTATPFTLFRDTYTLPVDFIDMDQAYTPESWRRLSYIHPREWLVAHRYNVTSSNTPYFYTITGSPDFQGCMAIRFYPYPDSVTSIDFIYRRRPRQSRIEAINTGKVSVTAGAVSVSSDGSGKSFTDEMVGSLIRLSVDVAQLPTGREGANPYGAERMIMTVESVTQLTVDQIVPDNYTSVPFVITDPIDLEPGVMTTAFLRCCESELAKVVRLEDRRAVEQEYQMALEYAKAADSRSAAPRSVHTEGIWNRRLAYMPSGADVD
jgi:hypothetical protein